MDLSMARKAFLDPLKSSQNCSSARSWISRSRNESDKTLQVCEKLFTAQQLSEKDEEWILDMKKGAHHYDDVELLRNTMSCEWVKEEFSKDFFVSAEEREFPIAYAINMDKYPRQILRFLKAIYRPHNIYCLHNDRKSHYVTKLIMQNVASCLGNVIIPRRIEDVYWGWYTIEEAYFSCFSDLVLARRNYPWKYVITLCGKELPLRTNAETVALLRPLNGTSSIYLVDHEGTDDYKYKWKRSLNKMSGWVSKKDELLPPIPYGLKVYKSWSYVALSHQFVQHVLCSPVGIALREYMKLGVRIPEENFFAMLFMQPGAPGGFREEHRSNIFLVSSYIWLHGDGSHWTRIYLKFFYSTRCAGMNTHNICMLGGRDLHRVSYRPGVVGERSNSVRRSHFQSNHTVMPQDGKDRGPLFHNRYNMEYDDIPMVCMEQELTRRNRLEYTNRCQHSK